MRASRCRRCSPLAGRQGPLRRRSGRRGRRRHATRSPRTPPTLVEVDYEPLPAVIDPYEATRGRRAAALRRGQEQHQRPRRDASTATSTPPSRSAAITVKARIRAPRCHPMPMETRGIVAAPDPMTRGLTVWTSTQAPHWNRNEIADALGLAQNQVRVHRPGGRRRLRRQDRRLPGGLRRRGAGAATLKRPVKWIETRSENFLATNHGRNQWADFEVGGRRERQDPRRCDARVILDSGAYPKALDLAWCTWVMSTGRYEIPNLDYEVDRRLHQHDGERRLPRRRPAGGGLLPRARRWTCSPTRAGSIRPRCAAPTSSRRTSSPTPPSPASTTTPASTRRRSTKALEVAGYDAAPRRSRPSRASRAATSASAWPPTSRSAASARARARPCASSRAATCPIFTGISPHGQGQETTFAQIAADYIGADFDTVVVHHGDTGNTPQGNGTDGQPRPGGRRRGAGALARTRSRRRRAGSPPTCWKRPSRTSSWPRASTGSRACPTGGSDAGRDRRARPTAATCRPRSTPAWRSTDFFKPADETFPFGTHIAVVEVFPETGEVKLAALRLGRRLRQDHQPDAGDRAGPRRSRPGHRPGALGGAALRRAAASC